MNESRGDFSSIAYDCGIVEIVIINAKKANGSYEGDFQKAVLVTERRFCIGAKTNEHRRHQSHKNQPAF
jgi:hypothetical protein